MNGVLGAVFELAPPNELTAIFKIAGIVVWVLAAFAGPTLGRRTGGAVGLIGLGLAVFFAPDMWVIVDAAFD